MFNRRWNQFSLRTLLVITSGIAATCGATFGRMDYLRRKVAFHSSEARKHFQKYRQRTGLSAEDAQGHIPSARLVDADAKATLHHLELAQDFDFATHHPWVLVSEAQRSGYPIHIYELYSYLDK